MKIAKVITECHECEHCKKIVSHNDNHIKAIVCAFETDKVDNFQPFLLEYSTSLGSHNLNIPDNCPLEDYKTVNP
jgi:hypothetical protein